MKVYEWKPNSEHGMKGSVSIRIPKHVERLRILQKINYVIDDKGESKESKDGTEKAIVLTGMVEEHVEKIDLTHTASKKKLKEFEDLSYYQEGTWVINELGNLLLWGIRLGKG